MALSSPKSGTLIGLIHRVQSPGSGRNHGGRDSMSNGHMALGLRSGRNLSEQGRNDWCGGYDGRVEEAYGRGNGGREGKTGGEREAGRDDEARREKGRGQWGRLGHGWRGKGDGSGAVPILHDRVGEALPYGESDGHASKGCKAGGRPRYLRVEDGGNALARAAAELREEGKARGANGAKGADGNDDQAHAPREGSLVEAIVIPT